MSDECFEACAVTISELHALIPTPPVPPWVILVVAGWFLLCGVAIGAMWANPAPVGGGGNG